MPPSTQCTPQDGTANSAAQPDGVVDLQTEIHAEANPETDAEVNPGIRVEADPNPDAEADPRFLATATLTPAAGSSPQLKEANCAQGIGSNVNAVSRTVIYSTAAVDSNGNAGAARKAGNAAIAMKRELEQQAAPAAKRHKTVSKASQAAMAAVAATARLPTQVTTVVPLKLEYLPWDPECDSNMTQQRYTKQF